MSKFKVGDRVRCVVADSYGDLVNGHVYTITNSSEHWIHLDDTNGGWLPSRFELVESPQAPQPQPDSIMPAFNAVHDAIASLSSLDRRKVIHAVKVLLDIQ